MITCFIRYTIDPNQIDAFCAYSRCWGEIIPDHGAQLLGYFAPYEGSTTLAYGVYSLPSLADYEVYRARLGADPRGRANYEMARKRRFIQAEERMFLKLVSVPAVRD